MRDGGEFNAKTASLAVPILRDGSVLGCFSVIWIRTAMKVSEAVDQFVEPMHAAARQLVEAIVAAD